MSKEKFTFSENELKAMEKLKSLMLEVKHINFQKDDAFLSKWLYFTEWNETLALEKIIEYYTLKSENPEWFPSKGTLGYADLINLNIRYPVDIRDKENRSVFVYKVGNISQVSTVQELSLLDNLFFDCLLLRQDVQINGCTIVMDCKDFPMRLIKWSTPSNMRIVTKKADVFPLKFHIHIVNASFLFNIAFELTRPFLSERLKNMYTLHKNWDSLNSSLGSDCFSVEFSEEMTAMETLNQYIFDCDDYVTKNLNYGVIK